MTTVLQQKPTSKAAWAERRKAGKPAAISVSQTELVKFDTLQPGQMLPLVVRPNLENLNLTEWVSNNLALVEEKRLTHGGILFRDFAIKSQGDFDHFVGAACPDLMNYMEGATPRTQLSDKVYTSTEFPQDQRIALHNELSYVMTFPMQIYFCCIKAAATGGETPIADMRKVYQRIPPAIRERFVQKGWMLVRNFGDGFGTTWEHAYHKEDKATAEAYFQQAKIEFEWKENGEHPHRLRTRQVRPAVLQHPQTGEMIWFNHIAFWHVSSLAPDLREKLLAAFAEDELPYNTFYGDGSPIEAEVAEVLRQAIDAETVMFPWQEGDVLALDNALVAHGRSPFTGQRRVLAAMGQPFTRPGW